MRPVRLEVQGFTCYRDPQLALDFSGMSLFAIAGPTGAGKSTILDAILYVLFGMVPRIGKQGVGEFISHGRDVLSVCLDFNVRGTTYRIARRVKRGKNDQFQTTAVLAEVQAAGEKSLADSVKTVDAKVAEILGLDFDAFTQTVILPQNQFARFLQSKPKDQRQILQRLLRLTVYNRMRAEAERRKGLLEHDLRSKDEQLSQLTAATPAAIEALSTELVTANDNRTAAQAERLAASKSLQDVRDRRDLTVALEKCRATKADLEMRIPEVGRLRDEHALANHAAAVAPKVETLQRANDRVDKRGQDVEATRNSVTTLQSSAKKAQVACDAAENAARGLDSLRDRLHRHHEIRNDVERKPNLARDVQKAREQSAAARQRAVEALTDVKAKTVKVTGADARVLKYRAEAKAISYDSALHRRLERLRADAARAGKLVEEVNELSEKQERVSRQLETAIKKVATTKTSHAAAVEHFARARAARQHAERERLEGNQQHSAAALRKHLVQGEPCPVCDHVVTKVPAKASLPKLTKLEAAVVQTGEAEQEASEGLERAGRDVERTEAKVAELSEILEQLGRDVDRRRKEQRTLDQRFLAALAGVVRAEAIDVLASFNTKLDELGRLNEAHEAYDATIAAAEKTAHDAALVLVKAQSVAGQAQQLSDQVDAEVKRLSSELEQVDVRIASVTSAKDPAAERTELARTIERLETELTAARDKSQLANEELVAAQTRLQGAQEALGAANLELTVARAVVDEALAEHGFISAEVAVKAARTSARISELDRQVREFEQLQASTRDRLADLEPQIAGREVDAAALTIADRRDTAAQQALEAAVGTVSRLEEQLRRLKRDVERAQRLTAERGAVARTFGTTGEMATDLRNDRFQEYLLEEAFKGLVVGASTRLQQMMSRRYTMEWRDSEFYVLDHDNGGERRRAETLSGGETFMASLCLALQLSDEVLHASGAIRMDSLFIDEGFGSLDVQSLSEVTDALENLRQDGDRIVGIISHIPELTARLPGCIRVEKGLGESTWVVERVG
jgi:DNA repair protein SbcC/Rad50